MTGTTISHYRIVSELGKGGMGVVYRAEDTKLDRTVALKLLAPHMLASEADRARFYREARAAAALHHPNIATVFEIDETEDGRPFIAMEFIEGAQLDEGLSDKPLPVERAVAIASHIAEALKAAHSKGIVHRDIKSANVMLTKDGVAKVLDFGLAKTDASTKLTQMGSTVGTIAYMSPEQARGEQVDHRTDLWSLGAVLYEMLTGRLPFPGSYEQAVVYGILNSEPEPVTAVRTGVAMGLEFIVTKLLSKEPRHRYQTAADLIADLETVDLSGSSVSRRSMPVMAPALRPGGRSDRYRVSFWGRLFLVLAIGALIGWYAKPSPEVSRPFRTLPLDLGLTAPVFQIALSPDGLWMAFTSGNSVPTSRLQIYSMESGRVFDVPSVVIPWSLSFSPDSKWLLLEENDRWSKLRVPDGTPSPLPAPLHLAAWTVRWAEDGGFLYLQPGLGSIENGIRQYDEKGVGGSLVVPVDTARGHTTLVPDLALPGGRFALATARSRAGVPGIVVADMERGTYNDLIPQAENPRFLASGFIIFESVSGPEELLIQPFDAASRKLSGVPIPLGLPVANPILAVTGYDLAYSSHTSEATEFVWLDDGTEDLAAELDGSRRGELPAISPDATRIAYTRSDLEPNVVEVLDLATGVIIPLRAAGSDPNWTPDGAYILFSGGRDSSGLYRASADGSGQVDTLKVSQEFAREPVASPDGEWIVYMAPGPTGAWNLYALHLATGEERAVVEAPAYLHDPDFSPDGKYVVYEWTYGDGSFGSGQDIRVHDFEGSRDWSITDGGPGARYWDPQFSADGRYVYFRGPNHVYRRRIELNPGFRVVGPIETVFSSVIQPQFDLSPVDGRVLTVRVAQAGFDEGISTGGDGPDLTLIQNWRGSLPARD